MTEEADISAEGEVKPAEEEVPAEKKTPPKEEDKAETKKYDGGSIPT